ncbi:MAG TPA: tetratricopeptide repeat protein [Nitrospirota bacterium]|nr:tetratricopeptide repeat protein [Nitrospirota bacterium]
MKYIATMLLVIVATACIVVLYLINPESISIHLTPTLTREISKPAFFMTAFCAGAGIIFILYFMRDVKRFVRGLRQQREQKKRLKIQELYTKGLNAMLAKRNAEAAGFFQRVLALDANHVDALLRLGISRLREKNVQDAILVHQKALGFDHGNQEVIFSLAVDYEEAKRFDDALAMYKKILDRDPSNVAALMKARDLYHRLTQWQDLYETQRKLVACPLTATEQEVEHRRLVGYKYELGRSHLEAGALEQARKDFRGVIKLDKDFVPAYLGLGEVYLEEGKVKEAAELWEKSYKMTSSVLLLLRLEDLYLKLGEPGRIIEIYSQAANWKPQDHGIKFFLGKLYYRLEMVDEAFDTLASVDWGDKEIPDVHKLLGNIYLRRGSFGLAASEFKRALGFKKQIIIPYVCSNCALRTNDWSGRCPNCGKWNTLGINLEKTF